ncbi:probable proline-specific permease (proline transport protein) [Ramularia collo-cygni]|uniref:Probable proline-specific permease (Proline transport protein) n=1 Tax=Ramularia collo-cygni TaxID=112498 RepID=A0A2D3UQ09_9PEZI|nr:probable proline-specific permease (proline transport protein) [Ramularia collo-cygni]CZT15155.1 probable proline-specific permease (proline transport protein) [Ramularia collo-cygni]
MDHSTVEKNQYGSHDVEVTKTHSMTGWHEIDLSGGNQLERGLKSRHIQFLALGGAIGTGLFIGSGAILNTVGPAPLLMAYLCMMLLVWNVMNCLAEMVTYLPLKGISIPYFVNRFVDDSLAFAAGYNYWYAYAILVAAEASAGAIILSYWAPKVSAGVWIAIFLVLVLALNIIAVSFFGEAEFWFASIKLITIIGLIILGIVLMLGGGPNRDRLGFRYYKYQNGYGAFNEYLVPGNTGKFLAFWTAFSRAGFAFITSPELIAISAGETIAPRRNIPKAARRFIYRLAVFYGLGSFVIGVIVPSNDGALLGAGNASASPFVLGIKNAGIEGLDHVINAAVLTSAWSAGNAFLYSGSRVLFSMALSGQAPGFLKRTTKRGIPFAAVLTTWAVGLLAFLTLSETGSTVFQWFSNISTISGFIAWIIVMFTYLQFRKAMEYNQMLHVLPYKTKLQPYATWATLFILIILTLTNGFQVFFPENWQVSSFIAAYVTIPIFLVLYLGHKLYSGKKQGFRNISWARKVHEIDVLYGKREMDELEAMDVPPVPKNLLQKMWFWVA